MKLFLPDDYNHRPEAVYFDDTPLHRHEKIHQPHVYYYAEYLLKNKHYDAIIDIGSGNGEKLSFLSHSKKMGLDFGKNLEFCKANYPDSDWVQVYLESESETKEFAFPSGKALIICSDVVEHLVNPLPLLALLKRAVYEGHSVITSTPDRVVLRGREHNGPPTNVSHIREWSIVEYFELLKTYLTIPVVYGHTINNNIDRKYSTLISFHDADIRKASILSKLVSYNSKKDNEMLDLLYQAMPVELETDILKELRRVNYSDNKSPKAIDRLL